MCKVFGIVVDYVYFWSCFCDILLGYFLEVRLFDCGVNFVLNKIKVGVDSYLEDVFVLGLEIYLVCGW